jgi:hypothetical protein
MALRQRKHVTSSTKIVTSSSADGWISDSQIVLRFESAKSVKWTGRLLITLVFFYFLISGTAAFVRVASHVANDQSAQSEDSLLLRPFCQQMNCTFAIASWE